MNYYKEFSICIALAASAHMSAQLSYEPYPLTRDVYQWPFSQTSIWNMPIGSGARYVHALLMPALEYSMTVDEDYIVMTPDAPLRPIYYNNANWERRDRCVKTTEEVLYRVPLRDDYVVSPDNWDGVTPNAGLSALMPDGRTIIQGQPFARCTASSFATCGGLTSNQDILSEGYHGAHGGSGLSAIGGTLRIGELTPTSGPIRHALKINVWGAKNLFTTKSETKGYRWPAVKSDGDIAAYASLRKYPIVKECRMGALLALPPFITIESMCFETSPAKILAQAFQDYGAYIVDDTAWDVYGISTEWGPAGRFSDDFKQDWGFDFAANPNSPFGRDMAKLMAVLHVVDNNSPDSIGGGGTPRVRLAPVISNQLGQIAYQDTLMNTTFDDWGCTWNIPWGPSHWWFEGDQVVDGNNALSRGCNADGGKTYPKGIRFQGIGTSIHDAALYQIITLKKGKYRLTATACNGYNPFFYISAEDMSGNKLARKHTGTEGGEYMNYSIDFNVKKQSNVKIKVGGKNIVDSEFQLIKITLNSVR